MKPASLPELVDCAGIQREMGVKRAAAEAIMRDLAKVRIPGVDKVYVRRADVLVVTPRTGGAVRAIVYVLDCDHGTKVGISVQSLAQRVSDLERGSGLRDIRVVRVWGFPDRRSARIVEQAAHFLLADSRTVSEWFHCHPLDACETIDRIVRHGIPIAYFRGFGAQTGSEAGA